jgi:hypothetical protein
VLSVWLAYLLARRICDPARVPSRGGFAGLDAGAPIWVACLAAANPFWIEYSQEARMYAALLAETLGLSLLYLRWLDKGARGTLVAYALIAALALYTHYLSLWVIAAHAFHALLAARRERAVSRPFSPLPLLAAQAAAGLLFVPWFVHVLREFRGISPGEYEPFGRMGHALWRMGIGPGLVAPGRPRVEAGPHAGVGAAAEPIVGAPVEAGPIAVFREEPIRIVVTALLWIVPIVVGVRAFSRDRGARSFVLAAVLVPIGLTLLAAVRWPLIHEKYLIALAPFLLLLAVVGARVQRFLTGDHVYGKEQWREAHALVATEPAADTAVLVHAPFLRMTWDFYARSDRRRVAVLPPPEVPSDRSLAAAEIHRKQVFLVLSHESTDARDHYRDAVLEALAAAWGGWEIRRVVTLPKQWGIRVWEFARP